MMGLQAARILGFSILMLLGTVVYADPNAEQKSNAPLEYQLLTFDASIAGAPAGTATIAMIRTAARYRIAGQARATGLLDTLSPWRASFWTAGDVVDNAPVPRSYRYVERGRDKRRDVTVTDDALSVIKNGKQRPLRAALPGHDVLTALFFAPRCESTLAMHTGRHGYRLEADELQHVDPAANDCKYQVTDDDQDTFAAQLRFGVVDGQRIPTQILVSGALSGRMDLTESKTVTLDCGVAAQGLASYLCAVAP